MRHTTRLCWTRVVEGVGSIYVRDESLRVSGWRMLIWIWTRSLAVMSVGRKFVRSNCPDYVCCRRIRVDWVGLPLRSPKLIDALFLPTVDPNLYAIIRRRIVKQTGDMRLLQTVPNSIQTGGTLKKHRNFKKILPDFATDPKIVKPLYGLQMHTKKRQVKPSSCLQMHPNPNPTQTLEYACRITSAADTILVIKDLLSDLCWGPARKIIERTNSIIECYYNKRTDERTIIQLRALVLHWHIPQAEPLPTLQLQITGNSDLDIQISKY